MDIPRIIQTQIEAKIGQQKVILLYGTRRTGKTTIIEKIVQKSYRTESAPKKSLNLFLTVKSAKKIDHMMK